MDMAEYKYKFSIVTAVYNVELFVAETIESIIAQDIGFENVQLILVDDGSPDNSGAICDEYAQKYPDNIVVIHKENGGVSSARNAGLELAEGKYINFIDSDDYFDTNTFSEIWNFFEANYEKTDAVAIPLMYFEGRRGKHLLNYKFTNENRVVDLEVEPDNVQMHIASVFIKREAISGTRFETRLAYAEDALFAQQIIMGKKTLGLVSSCNYRYRVRKAGPASAIQSGEQKKQWYLPVLKYFHCDLVEKALNEVGYVPRYLQYVLMYDLQWRVKKTELPYGLLSDSEVEEYINLVKKTLQYIDDDILMARKKLYREHKIFALKLKYENAPEVVELEKDIIYSFSDDAKFKVSKCRANLEFLNVRNNCLELEGFVSTYAFLFDNLELVALVNDKAYPCQYVERDKIVLAWGEEISKVQGFSVKIPLSDEAYRVRIAANINGKIIPLSRLVLKYFLPLSVSFKYSYCCKENWVISVDKNVIHLRKATLLRKIAREVKYLLELFAFNHYRGRKAAINRIAYRIYKAFKRKPVWLISDRASIAGDNGEALFRYMRANHKEIDARFVLLPFSEDFERLKKIGPVVKKGSIKHKRLALISEYIISSHAENEIFNPNGIYNCTYRDIWNECKFVFLQHGVTQNDVSKWLGKYNKNFFGLVSATKPEYKAFLQDEYHYNEDNIWLTGFARFDRLYNDSKKQIVVMPTWRRYLAGSWDVKTDRWTLVPDFQESAFFRFYNSLINDEKLLEAAKKYGYTIVFFPHPTLQPYLNLFDQNEAIEFLDSKTAYKDIYAHSDLVITDYSSAVFDFAYLKKPIVYAHFDVEEFFGGSHVCKTGYFEYERDGFGEVEYDLESTVNRIIEYIENGCQLKEIYRERIDNFFMFSDQNNCQRIYEKLIEGRK